MKVRSAEPPVPSTSKTATLVRENVPRPLAAIVRILGTNASPPLLRLKAGKCVIGSGADADVVVSDPTVSRAHVALRLASEGVHVTDLGSHNGTFYLGQRIQNITLALGGRIQIGTIEVRIDVDTEALNSVPLYEGDDFRGLLGRSPAMRRLFALLQRLEGSLVTVLVTGPSGVGKELVARAIHDGSSVSAGPMIAVNCGAISQGLVASELFGHKRGAFTGAIEARRGAFELASGGTLFLDEVGELPLDVQPMLLRALETGDVRPVGAERSQQVRVRVVAATNRDLANEVEAGRFREDLYYRLAVVRLGIPRLADRPEDIEPIAEHFAAALGVPQLPRAVLEQLRARPWRGNVRELRNALETYAALGALPEGGDPKAETVDAALESLVDVTRPYAEQKEECVDRFTRIYLQALLRHSGGNQTVAARVGGLDRTYLGRILAKYGLTKP